MVNRTSNMDSRLSELFCLSERLDLELAKGVQIIEVGLYLFLQFGMKIIILLELR